MNGWRNSPSLKFLVPPPCANYNLSKPPSLRNPGGGIPVKYARVREACQGVFNCELITDVGDIEPGDIVFADWQWFGCTPGKPIIDQVKCFIELENTKGIYGSELSVLNWPSPYVPQLIDVADVITHNTEYQEDLYKIIGIYSSQFLCDPIPESVFSPYREPQKKLVCMGQISEIKNSKAIFNLFKALSETDIARIYIGGHLMWGNRENERENRLLRDSIKSVSDVFVENATQDEVASIINSASFYAHVSIHDVASSGCQENMMAGNVVVGLGHPVLKERTPYRFPNIPNLAKAIIEYPFGSETHQQDSNNSIKKAEAWNYEAWLGQMSRIIEVIT